MTMADRIAVMNQGRIEQIGPPVELYEQPQDGVRGRLPGRVEPDRGHRRGPRPGAARGRRRGARCPRRRWTAPPASVRIGVRPEKVRLLPASDPAEAEPNRIDGTVQDVSYIGVSTQYIIHTPAGDELVAFVQNAGRGAPSPGHTAQPVQVLWDPEQHVRDHRRRHRPHPGGTGMSTERPPVRPRPHGVRPRRAHPPRAAAPGRHGRRRVRRRRPAGRLRERRAPAASGGPRRARARSRSTRRSRPAGRSRTGRSTSTPRRRPTTPRSTCSTRSTTPRPTTSRTSRTTSRSSGR